MSPNEWPAPDAGERDVLCAFLELQRGVVLEKSDGLEAALFFRTPMASRTSIAGVVQHLAAVERYWFRRILAGEDWAYPGWESDDDADWLFTPGVDTASVLGDYRAAIAEARGVTASMSLEDPAANTSDGRGPVSLRWVLTHMIEETARHAGHIDILREQADGTVGW